MGQGEYLLTFYRHNKIWSNNIYISRFYCVEMRFDERYVRGPVWCGFDLLASVCGFEIENSTQIPLLENKEVLVISFLCVCNLIIWNWLVPNLILRLFRYLYLNNQTTFIHYPLLCSTVCTSGMKKFNYSLTVNYWK